MKALRKQTEITEHNKEERTRLNQILLDAIPCVAILFRRHSYEIVASNKAAQDAGAVPGKQCYATFGKRETPCTWCLAPKLWDTSEAQHTEVERSGVCWNANWVPVDKNLYLLCAFDISERKRVEEALRVSERLYRTTFEATLEGIWWIDNQAKTIWVNQRMADMLGYTMEEMKGCSAFEFMDQNRVGTAPQNFINPTQDISKPHEFCFRRKDGSELWAIVSETPVMSGDGSVVSMYRMVTDITDRKHMENQIHQSKQLLQTMIDLNSEAVFMIDLNGVIIAANHALALRLKKDVTQIIGCCIYEFLPPDIAKKRREYVEESVRTGKKVYFEDQRQERHYVHILNPEVDEDGKVARISILAVDITERKLVETMLRRSGERYLSYVETMKEGFIVITKNSVIVYVNQEFCRITAYEKTELIGTNILHLLDRENQRITIVKEQLLKIQRAESTPYEITFIRKDRNRITSLVSPTPVFGIDGDYQGSFAVITDISQQKQTEKILIAEQKQLKEQVESAVVHIDNLLKESEEYRLALKVLLKNNDDEKKTIEESFVTNVRNTITPFLDRLKNTRLNDNQKQLIEVIPSLPQNHSIK